MGEALRVVIADDHPVFRDGLRALLETESEIVVVGEASTGAEAVGIVEELQPDVAVMDLHMPDPTTIAQHDSAITARFVGAGVEATCVSRDRR